VAEGKYFEIAATNQNFIQEEIKRVMFANNKSRTFCLLVCYLKCRNID
jgi:hypothetical protein